MSASAFPLILYPQTYMISWADKLTCSSIGRIEAKWRHTRQCNFRVDSLTLGETFLAIRVIRMKLLWWRAKKMKAQMSDAKVTRKWRWGKRLQSHWFAPHQPRKVIPLLKLVHKFSL